MQKTKYIWFNGKFVAWHQAKIHVLTHALNYGTGIFEGIRCYSYDVSGKNSVGGALFRPDDHLERFFNSGSALGMKMPFTVQAIKRAIVKTVKKNGIFDVYVRPLAFYGYEKLGPNPASSPVEIIIACVPLHNYMPEPFIRVKTSGFRRIGRDACIPGTKITGMYFNSALASLEAWQAGYHEAIMLDNKNYVAEGAVENIFMVKSGRLIAPVSDAILPGITRDTVFSLARDLGLRCGEKKIRLPELKTADEIFFCGTGVEIHSIGQIDSTRLSRKNPVTQKISNYYHDVVRGKVRKYRKWLTIV